MKKGFWKIWLLLLVVLGPLLYFLPSILKSGHYAAHEVVQRSELESAAYHYGEEIRKHADAMGLPAEYFLALTVLECSGKNPPGSRFEPHVYEKLKEVRSGDRRKYENIRQETVIDASDEALRNLATSWGPFQLMGYKCVGMDVNVSDIRGDEAVYYGMLWIKEEYGKLLRKKRYKDAFHYHNTGRKYPVVGGPRTHDPRYVEKGLSYMKSFQVDQLNSGR
ncbi:MAG: hypothetical protein KDC12_06385 [Flavobacteriales bacterium]|nr:hypothetical protein [Flavobacteriales bacterium]